MQAVLSTSASRAVQPLLATLAPNSIAIPVEAVGVGCTDGNSLVGDIAAVEVGGRRYAEGRVRGIAGADARLRPGSLAYICGPMIPVTGKLIVRWATFPRENSDLNGSSTWMNIGLRFGLNNAASRSIQDESVISGAW